MGEPSGGKDVLFGLIFFDEVVGELWEWLSQEDLMDGLGHEAVAVAVEMDTIVGEVVIWIDSSFFYHVFVDGCVNIGNLSNT